MSKLSDMTGSVIKVLYQPEFSTEFTQAVRDNVTPSMVSNPDDKEESAQFNIETVRIFVDEVREDTDLIIHYGFTETDFELFDYIKRHLRVEFIEI